jgi:hypothetical protein
MPIPSQEPAPRPSSLSRLMTGPVSTPDLDRRARAASWPVLRAVLIMLPIVVLVVVGFLLADIFSQIPTGVAPRHRAEALCFQLERPDPRTRERFAPPMRIEPSAALVEGHFSPGTSAGMALRQVMHLDESMVLGESRQDVGDYSVSALWLDLPPGPGGDAARGRHWLVLAWMEGADLAVCNFRFAGTNRETSSEERDWASNLMTRLLVPGNFKAGTLPRVRLWVAKDATVLPPLGPSSSR